MKRLLSLLAVSALLPFSVSGMEKEKPIEERPIDIHEKSNELHWELDDYAGDTKKINNLLEKGADPNAYKIMLKEKLTPLARLARTLESRLEAPYLPLNLESFERAVEILLEHGADITRRQRIVLLNIPHVVYVKKSNYALLKPLMPNLDDIIFKVKNKKLLNDYFIIAVQNDPKTNQSIIVSDREFKLNEAIVSTRCPKLLELISSLALSHADFGNNIVNKKVKFGTN